MYFTVVCLNRPDVADLREKARSQHLQYLEQHRSCIQVGYPFEDDEVGIEGILFVIDVANRAAAKAFANEDPFRKAGLFQTVMVRPWNQTDLNMVPGADPHYAQEALAQ